MDILVEKMSHGLFAAYNESHKKVLPYIGSGMSIDTAIEDYENTIDRTIAKLKRKGKTIPPELLEPRQYVILPEKRKTRPKSLLGKIRRILFG